jgi:hypothetical protein
MATSKPTGWVGWVYFASVMIFIVGSIQLLAGFVALFKDDFYLATGQGLIAFDYTEWGWIHLLLGLGTMAVAWAIAVGKLWGRILGVGLAVLSLLTNAAFLPAYPIWSIIVITVDILVIYALTMHGSEVKA